MYAFTVTDRVLRSSARVQSDMAEAVQQAAVAPVNGELGDLDRTLADFEIRYGVSTEQLEADVRTGVRKETADICEWLNYADLRRALSDIAEAV